MIIIYIDITISKTDMIIFEINIAYVSNLAHACYVVQLKSDFDVQQTQRYICDIIRISKPMQ
jgi:hypothetical protein